MYRAPSTSIWNHPHVDGSPAIYMYMVPSTIRLQVQSSFIHAARSPVTCGLDHLLQLRLAPSDTHRDVFTPFGICAAEKRLEHPDPVVKPLAGRIAHAPGAKPVRDALGKDRQTIVDARHAPGRSGSRRSMTDSADGLQQGQSFFCRQKRGAGSNPKWARNCTSSS